MKRQTTLRTSVGEKENSQAFVYPWIAIEDISAQYLMVLKSVISVRVLPVQTAF
jgi:hypothetical protein